KKKERERYFKKIKLLEITTKKRIVFKKDVPDLCQARMAKSE
ncbi:unnamed protein product, partial [marine sediment metagenome]